MMLCECRTYGELTAALDAAKQAGEYASWQEIRWEPNRHSVGAIIYAFPDGYMRGDEIRVLWDVEERITSMSVRRADSDNYKTLR